MGSSMTSQPTRRRRRLPTSNVTHQERASGASNAADSAAASSPRYQRRVPGQMREHHVTTDYSYVHKDLLLVLGVTAVTTAFIVAMSFVL